jgi:hypothetical protein
MVRTLCSGQTCGFKENLFQNLHLAYLMGYQKEDARAARYEALNNNVWVSDFSGALSVGVLLEYLQLWDTLQDINMQSDTEDTHVWCFTANGQYSAKTAYEAMFVGATEFSPWERIWKTWAPPKCRFFMWLVGRKRCWTADRLA